MQQLRTKTDNYVCLIYNIAGTSFILFPHSTFFFLPKSDFIIVTVAYAQTLMAEFKIKMDAIIQLL